MLSLQAWGSAAFNDVLKKEINTVDPAFLPLQQGLSHSSYALADNLSATILSATEQHGQIEVKAGIFYSGIISGCSCADDPTPVDEVTEYCEVLICIDASSGEANITLLT